MVKNDPLGTEDNRSISQVKVEIDVLKQEELEVDEQPIYIVR